MTISPPQFDEAQPAVLVIDDSPDVHRLLKARLRHEELDLRAATSGRAGIDTAKESRPAIILLDLDMPDMDGFEVLRNLKNESGLSSFSAASKSTFRSTRARNHSASRIPSLKFFPWKSPRATVVGLAVSLQKSTAASGPPTSQRSMLMQPALEPSPCVPVQEAL